MNALLLTLSVALNQTAEPDPLVEARREFAAGRDLRDDGATARPHFALAAGHFRRAWERGSDSPELARNRRGRNS